MSADNWKKCPKCADKLKVEIEHREKEIKEKYGKITLEKYEKLKVELESRKAQLNPTFEQSTLREDYEIYSEDYELYMKYSCSCEECGFSYKKVVECTMT